MMSDEKTYEFTTTIGESSVHQTRTGEDFTIAAPKDEVPLGVPPGPYVFFRPFDQRLIRERPELRVTLRIWPPTQLAYRPRAEILWVEMLSAA